MMPDGFTGVAGGALRILENYGSVHNQEKRVDIALKQVNGAIQSIIKKTNRIQTNRVNAMYSKHAGKACGKTTLEKTPKRICIVH